MIRQGNQKDFAKIAELITKLEIKGIVIGIPFGYESMMEFIQNFAENFDEFLYKEVGYDLLNRLVTGLFASPYAATSLREYFANGFEYFFCKDSQYLQKISPKLYSKILNLTSAI